MTNIASLSISDAAAHGLSKVVRMSERAPVELTSFGKPVAMVLSAATVAGLEQTLRDLGATSLDDTLTAIAQRQAFTSMADARTRLGVDAEATDES